MIPVSKDSLASCCRAAFKVLICLMAISLVHPGATSRAAADDAPEEEVVDRIVAVVNQDIIKLSEVETMLEPFARKIQERNLPRETEKEMLSRAREEIINERVDELLTSQKAEELGIRVSDKEVDAALEQVKKSQHYSDEQLRQSLDEMGFSMDLYRQQLKNQITRTRVLTREVKSKIAITQEDVQRYFEEHREEYAPSTKYYLKNIIMQPEESNRDLSKQELLEKMEEIREKIKAGEASFEEMARKHSQSSFAEKGGDLGLFELEELSPQLREEVEKTSAGEVTPVLESGIGLQLFYVEDIIHNPGQTLETASEEIRQTLYEKKLEEKFNDWIKELREDSHIKIIR
ncbi:MAG: SurA N-terminal domain-containing protein [Desulfosudaceae bacterium]